MIFDTVEVPNTIVFAVIMAVVLVGFGYVVLGPATGRAPKQRPGGVPLDAVWVGAQMVGRMFYAKWMLREMLITAKFGTILQETFANMAITKCAVKLGLRRRRNWKVFRSRTLRDIST